MFQIPYDFSQRLMARTGSVELAGNPWVCVCGSQITDVVNMIFLPLNISEDTPVRSRGRFIKSIVVYLMTALCFAHLYFLFQNLIAKVKDSSDVRCGPGSTAGLIGERVDKNIFEEHDIIFP